jgi:hypothetical protein
VNNIAAFHANILAGKVENPTVAESVRSNLVTILGRSAAYQQKTVTWEEVLRSKERMEPLLKGLKD